MYPELKTYFDGLKKDQDPFEGVNLKSDNHVMSYADVVAGYVNCKAIQFDPKDIDDYLILCRKLNRA